MTTYRTFTRTWWKLNPAWPDGREPCPGKRTTCAKGLSEDEARAMCKEWNATHAPGKLSRKMEYEAE